MDKMKALREQIDILDDQLMFLLSKRYDISSKIGEYKSNSNIEILDNNREQLIINKTLNHSHSPQLELVYRAIMDASKNIQGK